MSGRLNLAFLGCGFITSVHSRHLRRCRDVIIPSYASRDELKAKSFAARYGGRQSYDGYQSALADPTIDAVVIAVPPKFHLDLTLEALKAGKHVLVEKPAFVTSRDYETVQAARDRANRVVLVGENDHYKPLAVCLRRLLREDTIGEMVFANFTTLVKRLKTVNDWRNNPAMAGGDAFFEEGIHWLHLANSLGPKITSARGYRPRLSQAGQDVRPKSMMISFRYDNNAVGALFYSREIPSLFRGLRLSKLFGRDGIISFESNGAFVLVRGRGLPELYFPGFRDIRGYQAMYRDFAAAIRNKCEPEMNLERALLDQRLIEEIYSSDEAIDE